VRKAQRLSEPVFIKVIALNSLTKTGAPDKGLHFFTFHAFITLIPDHRKTLLPKKIYYILP